MLKNATFQDLAAAASAFVITVGVVILGLLQLPVPDALSTAQGASITWLFMRSAQQAEHQLADNHDRAP